MKKEQIYIDLSKCSEEQEEHIFYLIGGKPDKNMSPYMGGNECLIFIDKWERHNRNNFYTLTELTYPEFIKLFEDEEITLRQQFESEIKAKGIEFLFESNNQNYITWLENKINSNQ